LVDFLRRKFWLVSVVHVAGGGIIWRYSLLFAPIQVNTLNYEAMKGHSKFLAILRRGAKKAILKRVNGGYAPL
jgi:hypothetical protein